MKIKTHQNYRLKYRFFPDVRILVLVGLALGFIICTLVIIFVCRRKRSAGRVLRPAGIPHTRLVNYPGKTLSIFEFSLIQYLRNMRN